MKFQSSDKSSRFKVGDRVVRINSTTFRVGDVAVIIDLVADTEYVKYVIEKTGCTQICLIENLQLEQVYFSPLSQALK